MNWMPVLSLAVLWAVWLVCGAEKTVRLADRVSQRVRKVRPTYRARSELPSLLRKSEASQQSRSPLVRNLQRPVAKRDSPVSINAQPNLMRAETLTQARSIGTRMRRVQRPTAAAKYSKSDMVKDEGTSAVSRSRMVRFPSGSSSPNILASFAGKSRVWIISAPHASEGYYRLMMSLLKNDVYCELAERHIQQIVLFHEEGEEGGKVRRITTEGKILEQPLDPSLIPKLMSFLKLEKGKFGMVLLKKTLQVEERYPYPVRLEAMYEVIDQSPIRRIEKMRQKGFIQKCKAAGVEGQVVEEGNNGASTRPTPTGGHVHVSAGKEEPRRSNVQTRTKTVRKPVMTTVASPPPTTRATTIPPTTTTTRTATRVLTTVSRPITTTTALPTTQRSWTTKLHTTANYQRLPSATTPRATATDDFYSPVWNGNRRDRHQGHPERHAVATQRPSKTGSYNSYTEAPTTTSEHYTKVSSGRFKENRTDRKDYNHRDPHLTPSQHKPAKAKPPKKKAQEKILSNEYEDKYDPSRPPIPHLEEEITARNIPPKKGKESKKHDLLEKPEKKKKKERPDKLQKSEKPAKKDKAEKKNKQDKDRSKKNKKGSKADNEGFLKPNTKPFVHPPRKSVLNLLDFFEGKRRLLLITTPKAENTMYVQQRDEYLESFCKMATRKISVITIFGTMNNSSMKIDHFQLDNEKPMKVVEDEDLVDQQLINELRKEYGMTYNDFFMVLTDTDMKVKQYYEVPIAMKSVFDLIDTFQSRIKDMEKQKKEGIVCKEDKKQSLENFLSRLRWRRRLLVISAASDEDWAFSQQVSALSGQACNFGLRHITVLKLLGLGEDISGVLELYPINGSSSVEREDLPANLVKDIRNYFQISPEYFSMLLVGKDGNVKSWYPSPMWSMAIVYDLIDSMQLRRQEMTIQQSLGMRCPEDEYGGYGYHSYHQGYQEGYQDDYRHHESYHHGYPY
ncbi:PREDICTED: coiled-coil domain-containing protein 80 [Gavialis gangeticus]|uniref:coiled-coil domain-containing protein 80 n=1 Tax=Gavialis gangeticus TaxID=94835 RepID=UPI00092FAD52|nr:PREDICTED: coiled-coil domain-containing protein 80 [Gavialis gangeticus]XP_019382512.1 PREDICTED: coiled-coil domain-containing protein 80 [Gavialis gangeticus]